MVMGVLWWGVSVVLVSLILSVSRLFNYLVILEKFKVLLLVVCLLCSAEESRMFFLSMVTVFVLEVAFVLVIMTRLCIESFVVDVGV